MEREDAARAGLGRYYTGRACHKGHLSERLTSNGTCLACCRDAANSRNARIRKMMIEARTRNAETEESGA